MCAGGYRQAMQLWTATDSRSRVADAVIGETLGSYRITRAIGEGGMGSVYLAEHTLIGRQAAIKVLRPELCHRAELVNRFFNEARAAGAVQHPCIVEIFDFGYRPDGSAFIVMELLSGEALGIRLRRVHSLPEAQAASLARQMCSGLAAAHAKGIVHRDIKPDNVFLVPDAFAVSGERVKILDFGIAKLAVEQLESSMRTRTGTVLGTPAYMAPEQCRGTGEVDHRADLYSLGCILYAMVCGRPPFVSDGMGELMAKHIYEPVPPPSSLAPVSPALEHVILRSLAKDPNARHASADELAAALEVASPTGAHPAAASVAMSAQPGQALPTPVSGPSMTTISVTPGNLTPSPAPSLAPSLAPSPTTPQAPSLARPRWPLVAAASALAVIAVYLAIPRSPAAPAPDRHPVARAPEAAAAAQPEEPSRVRATVEVDVARASDDEDATNAPPTPDPVTLRISSIPPGAHVYRMPGREPVGTTPVELSQPPAAGEAVFVVERRGHRAETVAIPADRDGTREVRLRARTRAPREQVPLTPGTTLDPFEQ
jgi:serine/threonine protein kinase